MLTLKSKLARYPALCFWFLIVFALIGLPGTAAQADTNAEAPSVLVLPFQINAQQDLAYLGVSIAEVIAKRLQDEGAAVITPERDDEAFSQVPTSIEQIRQNARRQNAAHVVWGTFTLVGDRFSMDVRLMVTQSDAPPVQFFAQGLNLENLITVTNETTDRIAIKLFQRQLIRRILVQGNQRIETDAILRVIKSQPGSIFKREALSRDLRTVYEMGFFDDVRVETQQTADGLDVIFHVKEKPTIRRINIRGNSFIDEEDIRNNLTITTGAILNIYRIRSNINQIETLYKGKNYHKVFVDYQIKPLANNQADLDFVIEEGPKVYVTEIKFEGNKDFKDRELKKVISISEKGFFYWLTSSGDLNRTGLDQDVARLNAFYSNRGYINARVGEPQIDIQDEGIRVTFRIEEGDRYKVGRVDVTGDLIQPREQILKQLSITQETFFNRERVRNDVLLLTDLYSDQGYAYADISPRINQDHEQRLVDITYVADKRDQVYFEKIIITGNTKTRDKVIRRELHVQEQGLFSAQALKRSIRNLYRLDFFEDIKVDTLKGSADDKMTLRLAVTEKPTGSFTFGAGYSTEENAFFTGSIGQRNLFGRGQALDFVGQIGSRTSRFTLSFTEPRLFDTRLSGSVSAYNQLRSYDRYDRESKGGALGVGYPVADYTFLRLGYRLDESEITIDTFTDVEGQTFQFPVPVSILALEGVNITSSANVSLTYDSRDRVFNTREGSRHSLFYEYAGLGGDIGFNKVIGQTMWFVPIYKSLIGFANAKAGLVEDNVAGKILPDYEKFYLGGISSLRGFGWQGVSLREENLEGETYKVGGNRMIQFNVELIFPLVTDAGINGVLFYDTGNVYHNRFDLSDLRQSAGVGIRWLSPIAPLRLEYGWILDRRQGERRGGWEFSLGGSF
jgi:outer membrane protein insertion porin family